MGEASQEKTQQSQTINKKIAKSRSRNRSPQANMASKNNESLAPNNPSGPRRNPPRNAKASVDPMLNATSSTVTMAEWALDSKGKEWALQKYGESYKEKTYKARIIGKQGNFYVCSFTNVNEEDGLLTAERAMALFMGSPKPCSTRQK